MDIFFPPKALFDNWISQEATRKKFFLRLKKVPSFEEILHPKPWNVHTKVWDVRFKLCNLHSKLWNGKIIGEERNVSSFLIIAE